MIGDKIEKAFNEQIKHELESAYLYLSAAAYFAGQGLDGMAKWMQVQAQEEVGHAMRFYKHITDRQGRVVLQDIKQMKTEWSSPLEVWKDAYDHEVFITGKINELVDLARSENDNPAVVMLEWFVTEQVEEEEQTSKVVQLLERMGEAGSGLVMLDVQLGKRGA